MLLLCITGLPLIFHHEIDDLLHSEVKPAEVPAGTPHANLDQLLANALANSSLKVPHFLIWDRDDPNVMFVSVGESITSDPTNNRFVRMDLHTGSYLDSPDVTGRFTYIMLKLHVDLFAGLPGKLFLGLMGILFCVAVISGIVVYAPSMRKLDFGAYRGHRPRIVRWLDIHNLAGILLVMWTLVVGFTGVINTWADLVLKMWQYGQLAEMTAQYRDRPPPAKLTSVQAAVDVAAQAARLTEKDTKARPPPRDARPSGYEPYEAPRRYQQPNRPLFGARALPSNPRTSLRTVARSASTRSIVIRSGNRSGSYRTAATVHGRTCQRCQRCQRVSVPPRARRAIRCRQPSSGSNMECARNR